MLGRREPGCPLELPGQSEARIGGWTVQRDREGATKRLREAHRGLRKPCTFSSLHLFAPCPVLTRTRSLLMINLRVVGAEPVNNVGPVCLYLLVYNITINSFPGE